jgi:hypothetical protein
MMAERRPYRLAYPRHWAAPEALSPYDSVDGQELLIFASARACPQLATLHGGTDIAPKRAELSSLTGGMTENSAKRERSTQRRSAPRRSVLRQCISLSRLSALMSARLAAVITARASCSSCSRSPDGDVPAASCWRNFIGAVLVTLQRLVIASAKLDKRGGVHSGGPSVDPPDFACKTRAPNGSPV